MFSARPALRRLAVLLALAAMPIVAAKASRAQQEIARQGTFTGRWDVIGKALKLEMGTERTVTAVRLEGAVVLEGGAEGLARGFRVQCLGMRDNKSGGAGRCVWKDRFDDEIWSEITTEDPDSHESRGAIVGGTGKFEGMRGEFQFDWVFMLPAAEEGPVRGYTTGLMGSWRFP